MRLFSQSTPPKKPIACAVGSGEIDFQALLREAVKSVNDTYQNAVDDLLALCSQLDAAVATISGNTLRIKVVELSDSPEEVAYEMQLHDLTKHLHSFYMYKVTVSGYPITFGPRGAGSNFNGLEGKAMTRDDLSQHFAELLTNGRSPLVIQISFALRKAMKCPWPLAA